MSRRPALALAAALLAVSTLLASAAGEAPTPFARAFEDRTMRVDLLHTGGKGLEVFAVDRVVNDGPWAGSLTRLLDGTNLGLYWLDVVDPSTQRVLYSRGYASLYGEWETTPESKAVHRTFRESLRFPWPKAPVQLVVKKRDQKGLFREVFSTLVDPASPDVNPAPPPRTGTVRDVLVNGPAHDKVDLLVLGDGYTAAEMPKFRKDVDRLVAVLLATEPFRSRKADFNVRALELPSPESGVLRPQNGIFRRSPLSLQYNIFGSERYLLTYDDRALRDAAAQAPYDFLEVLANDAQYGGGGIYNHQATCAADTGFADYVFVHEFGHHFAALADEYYTSDVAYETGAAEHPEPWEWNVTAMKDPARLKWKDLVEAGTPLPTPWQKEAFEKQSRDYQARRKALLAKGAPPSAIDDLFREQQRTEAAFFAAERFAGKVGAFEGASYEAKGLYRSSADCIMFTRTRGGFCPVCRRAIERVADDYSRP